MHGLKQKKHNGFGLIEIVVSVGIVGTVLSGVFFFYQKSLFINQRTTMLVQTNMLLVEGVEVVKFLRDDSWSTNITSFPTSTPQYLVFTSGDWEVVSTSTQIDNVFTRWFVLEDVYRDGNDDIAASGTY
ncbi:MAG: type II secretion system protein, partial [Candidatus Pacebacteria bacterium]|nr:type II secretion system protein [Candidatus Paceibacterota bacterium]